MLLTCPTEAIASIFSPHRYPLSSKDTLELSQPPFPSLWGWIFSCAELTTWNQASRTWFSVSFLCQLSWPLPLWTLFSCESTSWKKVSTWSTRKAKWSVPLNWLLRRLSKKWLSHEPFFPSLSWLSRQLSWPSWKSKLSTTWTVLWGPSSKNSLNFAKGLPCCERTRDWTFPSTSSYVQSASSTLCQPRLRSSRKCPRSKWQIWSPRFSRLPKIRSSISTKVSRDSIPSIYQLEPRNIKTWPTV